MDKRIEAFLNNELSEKEIGLLEEQLRSDQLLAEELAFFLSVKRLGAQDSRGQKLDARHREWLQQRKKTRVVPLKTWGLAGVAAALVISIGLTWLLRTGPGLEELSAQYVAGNFQTLSVQMSGNAETDSLQTAITAYNAGSPEQALTICETILRREPDNAEAKKTGGIAALRLKNYEKAIFLFRSLGDQEGLYGNPGRFYEAITRLQEGGEENKKVAAELLDEVSAKGLEGKKEVEKWRGK